MEGIVETRITSKDRSLKDNWTNPGYLYRISSAVFDILDDSQTAGNLTIDQSRQLGRALELLSGVGEACILKSKQAIDFCGDINDAKARALIQASLISTFSEEERSNPGDTMRKILSFSILGLKMWESGVQIDELNQQAIRLFGALRNRYHP